MSKIVLKASAGTGKTYRLSIEFIVSLLKGSKFDEILVLTFTKKATGEIRERILEFIDDILYKNNGSLIKSVEEKLGKALDKTLLGQIYEDMLKNKEAIKIYTIDSFIGQIFKKIVGPNLNIYSFDMINSDKNSEYFQMVLDEMLTNKKYFSELKGFFKGNSERKIENYHKFISSFVDERWKMKFINRIKREKFSISEPSFYIPKLIDNLRNLIIAKGNNKDLPDAITSAYKGLINITDERQINNYVLNNISKIMGANNFFNGTSFRVAKKDSEEYLRLREISTELHTRLKEDLTKYIFNEEILPLEENLFDFGIHCQEFYDKLKIRDKKFTFNDISYYVFNYFFDERLGLVENNACSDYLYEILDSPIKTLFIDEFQDTSIIQWSILQVFANSAGEVICVGDEKQSIYSWRGGEKRLFEVLEDIIGGQAENMNTCYRSNGEIIKFINSYFKNISSAVEFPWDYSAVEYLPSKEGGYIETQIVTKDSEESPFDRIVEILKGLSNYSKVGIIARTGKELLSIGEALANNNIPFITNAGLCIVEHKALKGIYSLIKYLHFGEYFYLLEFLRSDLINIDSNTLKSYLENRKFIETYLNSNENSDEIVSVNLDTEVLNFIKELKRKKMENYKIYSGDILLDNLCKTLIEDLGLTKKYSSNSDLKNIYRFYEILKSFSSLADFIDYIEENREEEELKQVAVDELNACRLMTIHKSKGLEFETEIYLFKESASRVDSNFSLYVESNSTFTSYPNYFYTKGTYLKILEELGYNFSAIEKEKKASEEINNLYVALTRAKHNLYIIYNESKKRKETKPENEDEAGIIGTVFLDSLIKSMNVDSVESLDYASKGFFKETPIESAEEISNNSFPFIEYFDNKEYDKASLFRVEKDITLENEFKRKTGSATHFYLENILYASSEELIRAKKITKAKYGNVLGESLLNSYFEKADKFINENSWIFDEKYIIKREFEIFEEIDEVIKTYRIDRLLIDESSKIIHILDFKTGNENDSQLKNYKRILEKSIGSDYLIETKFLNIK